MSTFTTDPAPEYEPDDKPATRLSAALSRAHAYANLNASGSAGEFTEQSNNASSSATLVDALSNEWLTQPLPPLEIGRKGYAFEELAKLGIKVRDFAYECTLPPVAPIPQFVGGLRTLKRERGTYEDDDDMPIYRAFTDKSGSPPGAPKKAKGLSREPTEPIDPQSLPSRDYNAQDIGLTTFSQCLPAFADNSRGVFQSFIPRQWPDPSSSRHSLSQLVSTTSNYFSPSSQRDRESQGSEPWIDTPLVTPNGSLQRGVPGTSEIAASQLDTEFQQPIMEDVTLSQLGFTPERSQQHSQDFPNFSSNASFAYPIPPVRAEGESFPPFPYSAPEASRSPRIFPSSPSTETLAPFAAPSPRYNLRDRFSPTPFSGPQVVADTRARSCDIRSTSLSPRRPSPRLRSPRPNAKRTSQSVRPVRRSARNAHKPTESTSLTGG